MSRFKNKVAIVTGGGTGIGLAITRLLVEGGARVVIAGLEEEPLVKTREELGDAIRFITTDITIPGETRRIVDFTREQFGRLDILVNNAGIGHMKRLIKTTDEEIDRLLAVNVKGTLMMTRDAIGLLTESGGGSIINISSVAGHTAGIGHASYGGSKAAIDRISRVLAAELGPSQIRVNSVAPGLTQAPHAEERFGEGTELRARMIKQTALRRIGQTEDIARTVAWLASEDAGWITGQIIQCSGGLLL